MVLTVRRSASAEGSAVPLSTTKMNPEAEWAISAPMMGRKSVSRGLGPLGAKTTAGARGVQNVLHLDVSQDSVSEPEDTLLLPAALTMRHPHVLVRSRDIVLRLINVPTDSPAFDRVTTSVPPSALRSLDVGWFDLQPADIAVLLEGMYEELQLVTFFQLSVPVLRAFLLAVSSAHRSNSYHNMLQSFSTAQAAFFFLSNAGGISKLSRLEALALMTSSICINLDHPGLDNCFQVHARTPLASLYNDISPLENYAAAVALGIMDSDPSKDLFAALAEPDRSSARSKLVCGILGTDNSRQHEMLSLLDQNPSESFWESQAYQQLFFNLLLKCAHVSTELRPFRVAREWADRLQAERCAQGQLELELGLAPSQVKSLADATVPQIQIVYHDDILAPLFSRASLLMPGMEICVIRLNTNRRLWMETNEASKQSDTLQ